MFNMTSITSRSSWPTGRFAHAAANECLTIYSPQWTPPMLRAIGTDARPSSRRMASVFPLLARALLLGVAVPGIAPAAPRSNANAPLPAYSRARRSTLHAFSASVAPLRSRSGLMIVPDARIEGRPLNREVPAFESFPSGESFAKPVDGIRQLYGRGTAYGVALNFEYPVVPTGPLGKETKPQ